MTWLQILAQAAIMATFVGVGIAIAAYFNGKHIKEGVTKLGEQISKVSEQVSKVSEQISKVSEQISKVSEQISKLGEELGKILAEMQRTAEQRHQEIVQLLKK